MMAPCFLFIAIAVTACVMPTVAAVPRRVAGDCVAASSLASRSNVFPNNFQMIGTRTANAQAQVTVAENFAVRYYDTYKVVVNTQAAGETYVLYQCGTVQPSASLFSSPVKFFEIPLTSVSVPDSTSAAFMTALNLQDRIAFVTTYVDEPCLQMLSGPCGLTDLNSTQLSSNNGVDASFNYAASSQNKSIAFTAVNDPGALNRAEWIKFMSLFFNKEAEANTLFAAITQNFNTISTAATAAAVSKPKLVAWLMWWPASEYGPFYGSDSIAIAYPTYKQQLTVAAGASILDSSALQSYISQNLTRQPDSPYSPKAAVYIYANQTDLLRDMLKDVDVVIDETRYVDSDVNVADIYITLTTFLQRYGLNSADIPNFKFLNSAGLLREDGQTGPDSYTQWFETAVVRPDQVLADLVMALHPSAVSLGSALSTVPGAIVQLPKPFFLRNVAQGQVPTLLTAQMCPINGCTIPAVVICPYVYLGCDGNLAYANSSVRCAPTCSASPPPPPPPKGAAALKPVLAAVVAAVALFAFLML